MEKQEASGLRAAGTQAELEKLFRTISISKMNQDSSMRAVPRLGFQPGGQDFKLTADDTSSATPRP